jgi:hypothetical protein
MTILFNEIDGKDVYQAFLQFYDKQGRFFEINYKGQDIGFLGVRPLSSEECELEVYIFPQYRNTITKGLVFAVLDFPQQLGFKQSVMTTIRPGLCKLLHFLVKGAKMETVIKNGQTYYMRKHP